MTPDPCNSEEQAQTCAACKCKTPPTPSGEGEELRKQLDAAIELAGIIYARGDSGELKSRMQNAFVRAAAWMEANRDKLAYPIILHLCDIAQSFQSNARGYLGQYERAEEAYREVASLTLQLDAARGEADELRAIVAKLATLPKIKGVLPYFDGLGNDEVKEVKISAGQVRTLAEVIDRAKSALSPTRPEAGAGAAPVATPSPSAPAEVGK